MNLTVSESESAKRRVRFCATLDGDTDEGRAGFGSSERNALYDLARQLEMHPGTLMVTGTIERVAVR